MGAFKGRIWSVTRRFVRTASGRQRFNVLGALNFATKKIETIVNSTYITSAQIIKMLEKLSVLHPGKVVNVVLDNARYQRCKLVQDQAISLGINLVFLPTYSPNLNLIERVWKLVKSRVLNSAYHETFPDFCNNIENFVNTLHTHYAPEMKSLVTDKFQIIDINNIIWTTNIFG